MRSRPAAFAQALRHTTAFRRGSKAASFCASGRQVWPSTTLSTGSTGLGSRWMGQWLKRPWQGKKPVENPTDRAKSGTKRSLLVEASGVPVGLSVAGANRNDFKLLAEAIQSIPVRRPEPLAPAPQHLCLDKGYDFEEVRAFGGGFRLCGSPPLAWRRN